QEVLLQLLELFARYAGLRQQSEAGVDAVRRIARRDDPIDESGGRSDARAVLATDLEPRGRFVDAPQLRQRQFAGAHVERIGHLRDCSFGARIMGKSRPCWRAQSMAI